MTIAQIHQVLDKLKTELEKKGIDPNVAKILEMNYEDENTFLFEYRPFHEKPVNVEKNYIESIEISMPEDEFKPVFEFPNLLEDENFKAGYQDAKAIEATEYTQADSAEAERQADEAFAKLIKNPTFAKSYIRFVERINKQ